MAITPLLVGNHSPASAAVTANVLAMVAIGILTFVGIVETIRAGAKRHRPFPWSGLSCALLLAVAVGILICT